MGLDVGDEGVEELADHREGLTTEKVQDLSIQVQQSAEEEVVSDNIYIIPSLAI